MLKGVNKLIIEINNPESEYFERAIFFVKPGKSSTVQQELSENADSILNKAGNIHSKRSGGRFLALLKLAGAASAGAAAASFFIRLLS